MASVRKAKATPRRGGRRRRESADGQSVSAPAAPQLREYTSWYGEKDSAGGSARHRILHHGEGAERLFYYDCGILSGDELAPYEYRYGPRMQLPAAIVERLVIPDSSSTMIRLVVRKGASDLMFLALIDQALEVKNYQRAADLHRLAKERPWAIQPP